MSLSATSAHPFDWKRFPEAEALLNRLFKSFLEQHAFAESLARRMAAETSTRFEDWVDHLVLSARDPLVESLEAVGYRRDILTAYGVGGLVFEHDGGLFPRLVVVPGSGPEVREAALKVESVADFSRAHDLGLQAKGYALGPYRIAKIEDGPVTLSVVERRGYRGFDPYSSEMAREGRMAPQFARDALAALDIWRGRRRRFDNDEEGFDQTESALEQVIGLCGGSTDLACHLVFAAERDYWESRNHAARIQKMRQDRLGLGWANHDHHTFRSSRRNFPRLISMFERLGFSLRERFHAGSHAGWGAQILEHPTTGIVIFADLDLAPEEVSEDFAHEPLADLPRPNTVGLWVGLHGESVLEAGMHHLEAQFDFDALRDALKTEAGIETMNPFSDFPFLRQAFTQGERWKVSALRADRLLKQGWIGEDQHRRFLSEGAIGSHLENLQRRDGFKGFNQQSVSAILAATDPRLQAQTTP